MQAPVQVDLVSLLQYSSVLAQLPGAGGLATAGQKEEQYSWGLDVELHRATVDHISLVVPGDIEDSRVSCLTFSLCISSTSSSSLLPRLSAMLFEYYVNSTHLHLFLTAFSYDCKEPCDQVKPLINTRSIGNVLGVLWMAPLVENFLPSQLEQHLKYHPDGKLRKPAVDLKQCGLQELLQYHCDLDGPQADPTTRVVCEPVLRLFRKYAHVLGNHTQTGER